eukprot:TRINITY_DN582_c0_g1_i6.p1 TRINITY_DN582_c0_g1~~TRINITY_DN582_c0_g1_i6.p1  ORF type:complete len:336 (+),score=95.91 TRINITY_DN582_c0_g1_i6:97-1104(+)
MTRALCITLLPLVAIASTCQTEHCPEGSTGGRALLQLAGRKLSTVESHLEQVEAMVKDVIKKDRPLTEAEKSSMELMKSTLEDISLPSIEKGHEDDQKIMDLARGSLEACNSRLENNTQEAATLKEDQMAKKPDGACRQEQGGMAEQNMSNWGDLLNYVQGIHIQARPDGVLVLDDWFADGVNVFKAAAEIYPVKEKKYLDGQNAWSTKKGACDDEEKTFEDAYCTWEQNASKAVSDYEECFEEKSKTFESTRKAVLDSAEGRKAEYVASKKILCFIDVLIEKIGKDSDDLTAAVNHCVNLQVDTSKYELKNTGMPARSSPDLVGSVPADAPVCE